MKVAGIDVGSSTSKGVILTDKGMYYSVKDVTSPWKVEADNILASVLEKAKLKRKELDFVMATGLVGEDWEEQDDWLSEVSCSANGAMHYFPSVRTIVDIGAESCRVNRCDDAGIVTDYKVNQKCGSGTGLFMNLIAKALEVKLDEIGALGLKSKKKVVMNSTCAVFAESEVVSLIHQGTKKEDILKGVFDFIAAKTASMARSIKFEPDVVFVGGTAKNAGLVKSLSEALGVEVLLPEKPEIISALGAALEAKELV